MGRTVPARLEAWFARRCAPLGSDTALRRAAWLVPLLCGLLSVLLGQDNGWDMRNYHLYNPFAVLNGRIGFDLAPGQWQSYFNPTLDVPYYLLTQALPGPVVGFIMGVLHGLNFPLLLGIGRAVSPRLPGADGCRVPLLLALAGLGTVGFLSELGNSMGDNTTSLFVLSALLLLLRQWDRLAAMARGALPLALAAGLAMGLGTGLKLTNATYAVGLCTALLAVPAAWWARLRLAFVFGLGVLGGMAVTAGWWFHKMWTTFGNPLFPQFNSIFQSPLAADFGVIDTHHLPHNAWEALAWPLVFSVRFERVSELFFRQAMWPLVYLLAVALLVRALWRRAAVPAGRERFLLVFFGVAFLAWMKLFSIHRYLVPIEMLAPLVAWVLFHALLPAQRARRAAGWALALATLFVFPFGTWGHAGWAAQSLRADVPAIAHPERTVVVTAQGDPPSGWMAEFFPAQVRFMALGGGFPETPAWVARILGAMDERAGPHYVLVAAAKNPHQQRLEERNALVGMLGLTSGERGCAALQWLTGRVRMKMQLAPRERVPAGQACALELQPAYQVDLAAGNAAIVERAAATLARYGLRVRRDTCTPFNAWVGDEPMPYLLCTLGARQPMP
jgi:Glycosyltransferase family 87